MMKAAVANFSEKRRIILTLYQSFECNE